MGSFRNVQVIDWSILVNGKIQHRDKEKKTNRDPTAKIFANLKVNFTGPIANFTSSLLSSMTIFSLFPLSYFHSRRIINYYLLYFIIFVILIIFFISPIKILLLSKSESVTSRPLSFYIIRPWTQLNK